MVDFDVLIMTGGSGTRLWPLSRKEYPKQFLKLVDQDRSMFQLTVQRVDKLRPDRILIVCSLAHHNVIEQQLSEIEVICPVLIIKEEIARNTAPAIAIGAKFNNTRLLVVPSDHIFDDDVFCQTIKRGLELTKDDIVIFGIEPTYPETGYGYIEAAGDKLVRFVEKPNFTLAQEYLAKGNFLWNSGVFLFSKEIIIKEFIKHYFDDWLLISNADLDFDRCQVTIPGDLYQQVKNISFDYAIMEKIKRCRVVPYLGKWSDIGSYKSLHQELDHDDTGNHVKGQYLLIESSNNYVHNEQGKTALIGVDNLIVVNTDDYLLIADKNQSQSVEKVAKNLTGFSGHKIVNSTGRIHHEWGWTKRIDHSDDYQVDEKCLYPNKKIKLDLGCNIFLVKGVGVLSTLEGERKYSSGQTISHSGYLYNPEPTNLSLLDIKRS